MARSASLARHWLALGLRPGATREEIEHAFRVAALRTHPDRGGCAKTFAEIDEARRALCQALDAQAGTSAYWSMDDLASVRMARTSPSSPSSVDEAWIFLTPVFLSVTVGALMGVRFLFFGTNDVPDRSGVRAGGSSRVVGPPYPNPPSQPSQPFPTSRTVDPSAHVPPPPPPPSPTTTASPTLPLPK